jgi:Rrf2 family protein
MAANTRFAVGVHLLTSLAWAGGTLTSEELAGSVVTNAVVLRRILSRLEKAGLVAGHPGRRGGFTLARPASAITLLDVHRAVGGEGLFAVHANKEAKHCPVSACIKGVLADVFTKAEGAAEGELRRVRLSDVVARVPASGEKRVSRGPR